MAVEKLYRAPICFDGRAQIHVFLGVKCPLCIGRPRPSVPPPGILVYRNRTVDNRQSSRNLLPYSELKDEAEIVPGSAEPIMPKI